MKEWLNTSTTSWFVKFIIVHNLSTPIPSTKIMINYYLLHRIMIFAFNLISRLGGVR